MGPAVLDEVDIILITVLGVIVVGIPSLLEEADVRSSPSG